MQETDKLLIQLCTLQCIPRNLDVISGFRIGPSVGEIPAEITFRFFPPEFRYVIIFPAGVSSSPVSGTLIGIPVLIGIYFIPVFIVDTSYFLSTKTFLIL